jgi:hypothetical protein
MSNKLEKITCRLCGKPAEKVMLNQKKTWIGFMHGEGINAKWCWTVKKEWRKE